VARIQKLQQGLQSCEYILVFLTNLQDLHFYNAVQKFTGFYSKKKHSGFHLFTDGLLRQGV